VGLPEPVPVSVLPVPAQIAQKLHAWTAPDDPTTGWVNDRPHDLVDLQLLARDLPARRLPEVRDAVTRLFDVCLTQRHGSAIR